MYASDLPNADVDVFIALLISACKMHFVSRFNLTVLAPKPFLVTFDKIVYN